MVNSRFKPLKYQLQNHRNISKRSWKIWGGKCITILTSIILGLRKQNGRHGPLCSLAQLPRSQQSCAKASKHMFRFYPWTFGCLTLLDARSHNVRLPLMFWAIDMTNRFRPQNRAQTSKVNLQWWPVGILKSVFFRAYLEGIPLKNRLYTFGQWCFFFHFEHVSKPGHLLISLILLQ